MTKNKVSILVPIYGVEKYIERCARSLFAQSYSNIEYVFVNDCTKDRSIEVLMDVLEEYPHRKEQVKLISHEQNRGLAAARNTGVANMTGDFLWHIDSDDYITTDAVEILVEEATKTNADIVIMGCNNIYTHKTIPCSINECEKHTYIKNILLNTMPAAMWNKFYNASFYKKTGILSIEGVNQGEDYAVVPRIVYYASKIAWLEKPLYFYDLTNQSSYSNNISLTSIESMKKADDILYEFFKNIDVYKDVIDKLYIRSMLFLIKTSHRKRYKNIINIYNNCDIKDLPTLSTSDRIIFYLLKKEYLNICSLIVKFYSCIKLRIL